MSSEKRSKQAASTVLMVRPAAFGFNPDTASTNDYQRITTVFTGQDLARQAVLEFNGMVAAMRDAGIDVLTVNDRVEPRSPDAVFPNNWLATFATGEIVLFPMHHKSRSPERRPDIVAQLQQQFKTSKVIDLSHYEENDLSLEGTGSLVLDRENKIAYACLSPRTDEPVLDYFCEKLGYRAVPFNAYHSNGLSIYHTNVLLTIGDGFAMFCSECMNDDANCSKIMKELESTGHEVVRIPREQQEHFFTCNTLQVNDREGNAHMVLSETAFESLTEEQRSVLSKYVKFLPVSIPTIESIGGGSARCMIAELFFEPSDAQA